MIYIELSSLVDQQDLFLQPFRVDAVTWQLLKSPALSGAVLGRGIRHEQATRSPPPRSYVAALACDKHDGNGGVGLGARPQRKGELSWDFHDTEKQF